MKTALDLKREREKLREERERIEEKDLEQIEKNSKEGSGRVASLIGADRVASLNTLIYRNSTLLTVLSSTFIIFTGLVAINDPSKIYIPIIIGLVAITATLLFSGARSTLKAILSFVLLLFVAGLSFSFSYYMSMTSSFSGIFFLAVFFAYFLWLSLSYISVRGKSRWGALNLSLVVGAFASYVLGVTFLSSLVGAGVFLLAFSLTFFLYYYAFSRGSSHSKKMPRILIDEKGIKALIEQAKISGYKASYFRKGRKSLNQGSFIATNGDYAYTLVPIYLEAPLKVTVFSKKRLSLTYQGMSIDNFIIDTFYRFAPLSRLKGADLTLVFLDLKQTNGKEARVIATPLPDSKKKIISVIMPASSITEDYSEEDSDIFSNLNKDVESISVRLSEKQRVALESHLRRGDNLGIEEIDTDKEEESSNSKAESKKAVRKK